MRLSIDNFGCGTYSKFISKLDDTRILNVPVVYDSDEIDIYNVATSGTSSLHTQFTNIWPLSAFTLSSTVVEGQTFETNQDNPLSASFMHNSFLIGITREQPDSPYLGTIYDHDLSAHVTTSGDGDHQWLAIYLPSADITSIDKYQPFALIGPLSLNYVVDSPLESGTAKPNFDDGIISINSFHTKNMYNQTWDCETSISSDWSTYIASAEITNCRKYVFASANNSDVFLVYTFGSKYQGNALSSLATNPNVDDMIMTEYAITSAAYTIPNDASQYEFIERIKGINAWEGSIENKHKANIFSVKILNSGLNESITDISKRSRLQGSINIILRKLLSEFIPANTELFNIYWEGR